MYVSCEVGKPVGLSSRVSNPSLDRSDPFIGIRFLSRALVRRLGNGSSCGQHVGVIGLDSDFASASHFVCLFPFELEEIHERRLNRSSDKYP